MGSMYLQSIHDIRKRYEIVKFDKDTQTVTLRNDIGTVFNISPFNKEVATKSGYRLEKDHEQSTPRVSSRAEEG